MRLLLLIPILSYVGLVLYAYFRSERAIFQPPASSYQDREITTRVQTADGETISVQVLPNFNAEYTILFSHGNAEDIGHVAPLLEDLRNSGFRVVAYDYRGYGTSTGEPTEKGVYIDADSVYSYLVSELDADPERIFLYGRSLGAAVATDLAARKPVAGLILEGAFVSAFRVVTRIPLLPFDKFRTLSKLRSVHCPILMFHGKRDQVIPFWHAQTLFEKANQPKRAVWVEEAGHNDVAHAAGPNFRKSLQDFTELVRRKSRQPITAGSPNSR